MGRLVKKAVEFFKDEEGQGMVEYGLIIALISIAAIAVLVLFKDPLVALFTDAQESLTPPTT